MSILQDQASFMNAAGQETKLFNKGQADLYFNLIQEEANEFVVASVEEDFNVEGDYLLIADFDENTIKEACDVIVVAAGYLISVLGAEGAQQAWDIVHANNVAKVTGKIERREDGKIMKGDTGKAERKTKMMGELLELLNDNS